MRTRNRVFTWAILAVLAGIAWLSAACSDPGPLYRGKTQAEWARELHDLDPGVHREALFALLYFDGSAVPHLIGGFDRLSASEFVTALDTLCAHGGLHPKLADLAVMGLKYKTPDVATAVGLALRLVGPDAARHEELLMQYVASDPSGLYAKPIAAVLPDIGVSADKAIPLLVDVSLRSYAPSTLNYSCYYTDVVARFGEAGIGQLNALLGSRDEPRVVFALSSAGEMGATALGLYDALLSLAQQDTTFLDNRMDNDVVDVLTGIGEPVVPRLVALYHSGSREEKIIAIDAISKIGSLDEQVVNMFWAAFRSGDEHLEWAAVCAIPDVPWADKSALPELIACYRRHESYDYLLPIAILDDEGIFDVGLIKEYLAQPRSSRDFALVLHTGSRVADFVPEIERYLKEAELHDYSGFSEWCEVLSALGRVADRLAGPILESRAAMGNGGSCLDDVIRSLGDDKWPSIIAALGRGDSDVDYYASRLMLEVLPDKKLLFDLLLQEVVNNSRADSAFFVLNRLPEDHIYWAASCERICREVVASEKLNLRLCDLLKCKMSLQAAVCLESMRMEYDLNERQEWRIAYILDRIDRAQAAE